MPFTGGQTALSPVSNSYSRKRILTVPASHFRFHLNSISINESFILDFFISSITISEVVYFLGQQAREQWNLPGNVFPPSCSSKTDFSNHRRHPTVVGACYVMSNQFSRKFKTMTAQKMQYLSPTFSLLPMNLSGSSIL